MTVTSHDSILKDIAGKLPVEPNARKRQMFIACMVIGVLSLAFLFITQPLRAWGSFAINTLYWLGIAEGGVVLACAIRITNGRWGGPIMRIGEALSAYLPWGIATMAVLLIAGIWTYLPWTSGVDPRQKPFLNVPFLYIRTLGGLFLFWFLARRLVRISLRPDARLLLDHVSPKLRPEYEKLSAGWRGDQAEKDWQRHELAHLSPQILLTFVVFFSVLGWDFIMALTPNWVSALFGWWVYAGAFISGIAMTAFLATQVRAKYQLEAYITRNHFWDIGKILFAWCIFWAYLFWSQYLPIWYANMPEETWWVFLRMEQPWRTYGFTAFVMIFLIPFLGLLNKTTKTSPFWLGAFSLNVLAGLWIERHVLVMPSLNPDHVWINLPEIGVTIGFMGMFGWAVQGFMSKYPVVKVVDALESARGHGH